MFGFFLLDYFSSDCRRQLQVIFLIELIRRSCIYVTFLSIQKLVRISCCLRIVKFKAFFIGRVDCTCREEIAIIIIYIQSKSTVNSCCLCNPMLTAIFCDNTAKSGWDIWAVWTWAILYTLLIWILILFIVVNVLHHHGKMSLICLCTVKVLVC